MQGNLGWIVVVVVVVVAVVVVVVVVVAVDVLFEWLNLKRTTSSKGHHFFKNPLIPQLCALPYFAACQITDLRW